MKDLSGMKFGMLEVVQYGFNKGGKHYWMCKCDCGNSKSVYGNSLINGDSKSCGCLRKKITSQRMKTHGMSSERLYRIWLKMKERCYYPKSISYKNYGKRGISICEEWLKFENFRKWAIENNYADNLSIDRIDVDGNYEPSNCKWSNSKEQSNNRRSNVFITFNGSTKTMKEWSEEIGISNTTIWNRLNVRGWSVEKALTQPIRRTKCQSTN